MVNNKAVATLPMFVHEDTAAKIMALSPEDLRKSLESINPPPGVGKLEPAAIDGACTRLVELQDHIQALEARGALVKEFNKNTYAQARAAQIELAGEPVLGGPNNGSIPRASYLGTAMIEKARTESLNGNENKPWEHRKLLDENDVPRAEVNEVYAQYQADVQQAREQISQNDPDLMRVKGEIAELQKDLNWQKQDAESMKSRAGAAERTNDPAQIKVANAAYEGALSTIEETQQKIAQKQERLEFLAEAKLENMKPRLAAKAYQIDVDKLGVEETNLQGELAVAQQDLAQAEEHIFEVLDQIANEGTSNREKFKLTQERIEEFQQQSEDAKFKIEKIQGQIEATQDKKAALEERIQTTLQQNPEWQRIAQPSANQERQFNIGERRNLGTPEIPGTSAERQPLERSARAVPPVTSQPGSLASNATESPAKVKTPARPELTHPGRPLPPIPGQEPKVNTAARPGLTHPGRPLPPIPGSEPKVEAAEVKAETPEKANTVKADMNADTETEKKDHSRKNSVGGDIKWKRPDSSGTSNERSVKDSIFRK
jgi:predicted  nucleic acid-binding Zn-ribbon protein